MKTKTLLLSTILISLFIISGCSKESDDNPTPTPESVEAYIQFDNKKNTPVTQKPDPYNLGQLNSCFFATTALDMTEKVGSISAITQVILTYSVPGKTMAEIDILAKAFFDGIAEGNKVTAKILGTDSETTSPTTGFILTGGISADTGVWDYSYLEEADTTIEISKVSGKIQFRLISPVSLNLVKRYGAGNPDYPSFTATSHFSIQMSL